MFVAIMTKEKVVEYKSRIIADIFFLPSHKEVDVPLCRLVW